MAAAIHPVVRAKADGVHYSSTDQYPMVPGVDAVARKADGTLVYTGETRLPWGTFAERMAVPMAAPLPPGADPVTVVAAMNPGMSSWMPLTAHVDQRGVPGTVLILGPTGAAGGLAVQNARALGVQRIIGVGRGAADLARVAGMGAETVELTGDKAQDAKSIAAALDGRSPELVLDYLWGTPAESAFEALRSIPGTAPTNYARSGPWPARTLLYPPPFCAAVRSGCPGAASAPFRWTATSSRAWPICRSSRTERSLSTPPPTRWSSALAPGTPGLDLAPS
ncbi:hypothetical protein ACQ86D_32625 [Streptomyces galilaeus]